MLVAFRTSVLRSCRAFIILPYRSLTTGKRIQSINNLLTFVLNQLNKLRNLPEALVVHDSSLINFLNTIISEVGKDDSV
ncbi:hypothetical protein CPT31_11015 [Enterobacter hormaechei]|nr:hypothetical protein MC56_010085 [Enterobacter hormaechei]POV17454.1 hypothetical protein C3371_03530 [Enterobacter cloacae complex sp. ECNIH13]POV69761.1 hypothetical protein C3390_03530 [Enterobacter cloacae complex sp. ECNIH15]RAY78698.1 hypothetical protein DP188_23670 [Enterobacter hormaechei subsp. steigerwaltii]QHO81524.1 hypothetical protein CPT31_11015 [Enterobacter hormaechei]